MGKNIGEFTKCTEMYHPDKGKGKKKIICNTEKIYNMESSDSFECFPTQYEDLLMKRVLQLHMPLPEDCQVDSAPLLDLAESILQYITMSSVLSTGRKQHTDVLWRQDDKQETRIHSAIKILGETVHHMSYEILQHNSTDQSLDATTDAVLALLSKYGWGTKLIIVLIALATNYGMCWFITHLRPTNDLASALAAIKGMTKWDSSNQQTAFSHSVKALNHLVVNMVSVIKCITEFESLPMQYATLDYEAMARMKVQVHIASYWVIRTSVACAAQIAGLIASPSSKLASVISASWELWSSARKIRKINRCLRKEFDVFNQLIEKKLQGKLLNLFKEIHDDNQKVLQTLFSMKDDFPLRDSCSQKMVGIDVLKDKVVILFISTIGMPIEKLLLIIQKLQNNSQTSSKEAYEVVWVLMSPMPQGLKKQYNQITDLLPIYSLHGPSKLSVSAMKYIEVEWHFRGDSMVVAFDSKGKVLSTDAFDAISIWGPKAYPFSSARERELWEEEKWSINLLLDDIDPLLSNWMADGRVICICGSNNIQWIRQLTARVKDITEAGILLELIYLGCSDEEKTKDILRSIKDEKLCRFLSPTHTRIFWIRLESMKCSKIRNGYTIESDSIMKEVNFLASVDSSSEDWLLISDGMSIDMLKLVGKEVLECLSNFQAWGDKIQKFGFSKAISQGHHSLSFVNSCQYHKMMPYAESSDESFMVCEKCGKPMEKLFMYQCGTSQSFDNN